MKTYTLGFLFRNGKIILAEKKRKIGAGKLNGYGGKIEDGEDKIGSLVREVEEECGVLLQEEKCEELGFVDFSRENKKELDARVYVYRIDDFSGEPKEMPGAGMGAPEEFPLDKIPYERMILGTEQFLNFVLEGKKFKGEIRYSEHGESLVKCVVELDKPRDGIMR